MSESPSLLPDVRREAAVAKRVPEMFPRVKGYCPNGCGQTLFLGSGGYVTCSWIACPDPTAAHDLLRNGSTLTADEIRHVEAVVKRLYPLLETSVSEMLAGAAAICERTERNLREIHEYQCGCESPGRLDVCVAQPVVLFESLREA